LREEGYSDISTQEVLIRTHDIPQLGVPQLASISSIVERLQSHETRKEERRVLQMKTAREKSAKMREKASEGKAVDGESGEAVAKGRVAEGEGIVVGAVSGNKEGVEDSAVVGEKRSAEESTESTNTKKPRLDPDTPSKADGKTPRARDQSKIEHLQSLLSAQPPTRATPSWTEPDPYPSSLVLTKPASEMRGHTSYLTFATLHPLAIRTEVAPFAKSRVDQLKEEVEVASPTEGSASDYGSEGLEEAMRTMTEEEMMSLAAV
jgi:tRNA (adenine57-N1/adenine58-N1)-methyltransferase